MRQWISTIGSSLGKIDAYLEETRPASATPPSANSPTTQHIRDHDRFRANDAAACDMPQRRNVYAPVEMATERHNGARHCVQTDIAVKCGVAPTRSRRSCRRLVAGVLLERCLRHWRVLPTSIPVIASSSRCCVAALFVAIAHRKPSTTRFFHLDEKANRCR